MAKPYTGSPEARDSARGEYPFLIGMATLLLLAIFGITSLFGD